MSTRKKLDHKRIESKWRDKWEKEGINRPSEMISDKKGFYNLWMFPYPSAEGLHAGHAFASTGSDVYGRFKRMNGYDVFQPIGYDSFGIHGENFAIKKDVHPKKLIGKTTKTYEKQLKSLGHGYDWTRTVTTSQPDYYRWTQWIFIQMFKAGLAYRKKSEVNWCPSCKTVLADEQVMTPAQAGKEPKTIDGSEIKDKENVKICERCGYVVEQKDLAQWHFRITDYADKLLENLGKIDWPEKIKVAQRNWIGKKEGIDLEYEIEGRKERIVCWTSRPDTNFGATFVVLAPEHSLAQKLATKENEKTVSKYIKSAKRESKEERIEEGREKTGVFTGSYAINNLNGYKMPIWVTDFVLADVGTGAVVGVPGHDIRDFEFAKKYGLEIKRVVVGLDNDESPIVKVEQVQEKEGKMVNSEFLNGMDIHKATIKMMDYVESKGWGKRTTTYHLRDWIISRQRYWGPPIPMIYCEKCAKEGVGYKEQGIRILHNDQGDWSAAGWWPVAEEDLPVELPNIKDYKPKGTGRGPLADHPEFFETKCSHCGGKARRETDVSDTFLDSSWYFLRYPSVNAVQSAKNKVQSLPWDNEVTQKWLPVDLYFGGAEHAVLHLMYARFVTMVLSDLGHVNFDEPFPKFYAHGLMIKDGAKMSKSRGNTVNPDKYVEKYGADTLRLYLMFMGPMDGYPDFRDTGIEGMRRFTERVWELCNRELGEEKDSKKVAIKLHQTIKNVTEDIQHFSYNTAIAFLMELINLLKVQKKISYKTISILVQLLAPFAPHLAEHIWCEILGEKFSVHKSSWPKYDPKLVKEEMVTIAVQVNGKLRSTIQLKAESSKLKENVIKKAKEDKKVQKWISGKKIEKEIFIEGKLVNFVVG